MTTTALVMFLACTAVLVTLGLMLTGMFAEDAEVDRAREEHKRVCGDGPCKGHTGK